VLIRLPRPGLSARIAAGFLALLVVFGIASSFAVVTLRAARRDLVVLSRGYLALGRSAAQLRTLQEVKDATVARALDEGDPAVRRGLVGFARELYPSAMREHLDEIQGLARQLQGDRTSPGDALFLETVFAQARRARDLADAYDRATAGLLESLDVAGDDEDRGALVDAWQRRSDGYSRELRAIALAVDSRAAGSLLRVESAEARSAWLVVVVTLAAGVVGIVVLVTMLRALRPLRRLADATRALQRGATASGIAEVLGDAPARSAAATADPDDVAAVGRELLALARALDDRNLALAQRSKELLRLSAFAEDVVRSVRAGIVVVDGAGRVRTINPAARSAFALPLVDVEGRLLVESLDATLGAAILPAVDDVRRGGQLRSLPLLKVKDHVVDVVVVPLRDRAGSSGGDVLLLGDDVTAREDARERLVQSERLAAIGRLAAQITHEIRNPLSSIGLNIELLGDDVEHLPADRQEEVRAILDAVLAEVRRLAEITEGYLRFARLPAPQRTDADLGDLCAGLVAFTQGEASVRGVNVELHVEPALPAVSVDADRLRQALLNLLRNGVDAAGRGGTVRVSARARDDGHDVELVVEDNGPGVPPDDRERIFSPFFTTKKEGTGLGLVVAREIAREHHGDLVVDTGALGGAAFILRLPAAPRDADESGARLPYSGGHLP
jgi:signal transduction histidine kinase